MTVPAEVLAATTALSPDAKRELAHRLWIEAEEPYEDPAEVDAAWKSEITHRVQGVLDGTTNGLTEDEVREQLSL